MTKNNCYSPETNKLIADTVMNILENYIISDGHAKLVNVEIITVKNLMSIELEQEALHPNYSILALAYNELVNLKQKILPDTSHNIKPNNLYSMLMKDYEYKKTLL